MDSNQEYDRCSVCGDIYPLADLYTETMPNETLLLCATCRQEVCLGVVDLRYMYAVAVTD